MPDNRMLVLKFGKHNYTQKEQHAIVHGQKRDRGGREIVTLITLEKFKDNLSKVTLEEEVELWKNRENYELRKQGFIPHQIKIYDDIMPIFTTMIGIMKKQEFEIDALKSKLEKVIK